MRSFFKKSVRNLFLKTLARAGMALNRLYENRNYDFRTNGEAMVLGVLKSINEPIAFDVGANEGNYTELVRKQLPNATIHAFEPDPEVAKKLKDRYSEDSRIIVQSKGLSVTSGPGTLKRYDHSEHSSLVELEGIGKAATDEVKVELTAGDEYMKAQAIENVDFIKIDVEGAEMEVIKGFDQAFSQKKIRMCQFEYGYANIISHQLLIDFYHYFESKGYAVGKIYPRFVEFRPYHVKHEDFLGPNYLAVHNRDEDLIRKLSR